MNGYKRLSEREKRSTQKNVTVEFLKKRPGSDTVSVFLTKPASSGREERYMSYLINVEGKMEMKDVNMAFQAMYVTGVNGPEKGSCPLSDE